MRKADGTKVKHKYGVQVPLFPKPSHQRISDLYLSLGAASPLYKPAHLQNSGKRGGATTILLDDTEQDDNSAFPRSRGMNESPMMYESPLKAVGMQSGAAGEVNAY